MSISRGSNRNWRLIVVVALALLTTRATVGATDRSTPPQPGQAMEEMLRRYGVETDTKSLTALVRERPESPWMVAAISLLVWRGEEQALPMLRELLVDPRYREYRATIAWGLAKLGDSQGIASLEGQIKSAQGDDARLGLASRLADVGGRAGLLVALELSCAPESKTRASALPVLVDYLVLAGPDQPDVSKKDIVEALLRMSRDGEASVRKQFVQYSSIAIRNGAPKEAFLDRLREMCRQDPDAELRTDLEKRLSHWALSEDREVVKGEACP